MDDVTISEIIQGDENSVIQDTLNEVNKWSCANSMSLGPKKCKELTVSFLRHIVSLSALTISNVQLHKVESLKGFGRYLSKQSYGGTLT